MKDMKLTELIGLSVTRSMRPVRAWLIARRIELLNAERDISQAAERRERERQKEIDRNQAWLRSELMQLKLK